MESRLDDYTGAHSWLMPVKFQAVIARAQRCLSLYLRKLEGAAQFRQN
jgi:hypothetical protein